MTAFMTTAFDAADPLADYRIGLGLAAEAELSDLVEALRLCAARAARVARGTPCRVTPAPAPASASAGGSANANRKAPWRSTRHLAEQSSAHDNALPPPKPTARDSSPSWAQVADALKPSNAATRSPNWPHAARARRSSKDHLKREARARTRARGAGSGRSRGLRA